MKQIIKRNGTQVAYNGENILRAVEQANNSVDESKRLTYLQIQVIEESVRNHLPTVATIEQIQDLVIHNIMKQQAYEVAQAYTEYRYKQALIRKSNSTDDGRHPELINTQIIDDKEANTLRKTGTEHHAHSEQTGKNVGDFASFDETENYSPHTSERQTIEEHCKCIEWGLEHSEKQERDFCQHS